MRPRAWTILSLSLVIPLSISPVGAETNSARPRVIGTIEVGEGPSGIGVNRRTNGAYVANFRDGTMSVIDPVSHQVVATVEVGSGPAAVIADPMTKRVYVA